MRARIALEKTEKVNYRNYFVKFQKLINQELQYSVMNFRFTWTLCANGVIISPDGLQFLYRWKEVSKRN